MHTRMHTRMHMHMHMHMHMNMHMRTHLPMYILLGPGAEHDVIACHILGRERPQVRFLDCNEEAAIGGDDPVAAVLALRA